MVESGFCAGGKDEWVLVLMVDLGVEVGFI